MMEPLPFAYVPVPPLPLLLITTVALNDDGFLQIVSTLPAADMSTNARNWMHGVGEYKQ